MNKSTEHRTRVIKDPVKCKRKHTGGRKVEARINTGSRLKVREIVITKKSMK